MTKYFTREGLEKIKQELNYLKTVKKREIAGILKHTASFGDLTENAAYQEAKEVQSFLEFRILELEALIKSAEIVESKKGTEKVEIGSTVWVICECKKEKFQIVGIGEVNSLEGKISFESPVGMALLGKSPKDEVEVETPRGKIKYKILEIE